MGFPLPGITVRVADHEGRDVADGETGEVYLKGPNVFAGYWRDAAATSAAFTADGWFRTGDLGRIDDRGFLHIVGRSKELIVLADGKSECPRSA